MQVLLHHYLKHYWVRNGEYLTEPGQNGPLQSHPAIPGLEVRYWLTDDNGVDYCLSTVTDNTLVTAVTPGLEVLSKAEWDAIVATIPEPEPLPEPEPEPEPTAEEKLAATGLSVEELKGLLGL